jgi:hypothetical protein
MGDGYTSLIKLRVTPEQKAQLEQEVGKRQMSSFIRERLFGPAPNTAFKIDGGPPKPPESRTSPQDDLQQRIKAKMGQGKTSKLAEIEAREELGL